MPGRRSTSRSTAAWATCLALLVALGLAGCSSSGSQYVSNSQDHTYFKVPANWKLFGEKTIIDSNTGLSTDQRNQILDTSWRTAFDASPQPKLQHLADASAAFPTGYSMVETLSSKDADEISDLAMRNKFFDVDKLYDAQQLKMLRYESVEKGGGFHGVRIRAPRQVGSRRRRSTPKDRRSPSSRSHWWTRAARSRTRSSWRVRPSASRSKRTESKESSTPGRWKRADVDDKALSTTFVSRPRDDDRTTRKPLPWWDRSKILVFLAALFFFYVWMETSNNPLLPVSEAFRITFRLKWWLPALFGIELLRQIHFVLAEHWSAYYLWWQRRFEHNDARIERISPWTRYRLSRVAKVVFWIAVLNAFVAWRNQEAFVRQLVDLPATVSDFLLGTAADLPMIF